MERSRLCAALAAVVGACGILAVLGVIGLPPASAGTDQNPCPSDGGIPGPTATHVAGRPGTWLVCQEESTLPGWLTLYMPGVAGLLAECPAGTHVIGGRSGSAYAEWNYSAGRGRPPSGKASLVSWGGIARWWERDGRWVGGVEPLLTNWGEPSNSNPLWVQVWFYCGPEPRAVARTGASPASRAAPDCMKGTLHEGGSPPPAGVKPPRIIKGRTAPPPPRPPKVEIVPKGHSTLHGGDGREILEARCTGDETIYGGHGTQTLMAGRGNDTLVAGTGAQTLIGGPGHDTLIGGHGRDTFFTLGPHNRILAGPGPSRIAALGKHDVVDCGGHPAQVLAVRGTTIRHCSNVHYVKRPSP